MALFLLLLWLFGWPVTVAYLLSRSYEDDPRNDPPVKDTVLILILAAAIWLALLHYLFDRV